jgi:hypothetical protein
MRICANCGSRVPGDPVVDAVGQLQYPPCPECTATTVNPLPLASLRILDQSEEEVLPPRPHAPRPQPDATPAGRILLASLRQWEERYRQACQAYAAHPDATTKRAKQQTDHKRRRAQARWHAYCRQVGLAPAPPLAYPDSRTSE